LVVDGKIYVYGGSYFNGDTAYEIPAKETFVMLDTVTLVWSIPPHNTTNDIPKLAYHSASLKGALMILAFGKLFYIIHAFVLLFNLLLFFFLRITNGFAGHYRSK
jgi:hypothetical protein